MKKFSFLSWIMITTFLLGTSGGYAIDGFDDDFGAYGGVPYSYSLLDDSFGENSTNAAHVSEIASSGWDDIQLDYREAVPDATAEAHSGGHVGFQEDADEFRSYKMTPLGQDKVKVYNSETGALILDFDGLANSNPALTHLDKQIFDSQAHKEAVETIAVFNCETLGKDKFFLRNLIQKMPKNAESISLISDFSGISSGLMDSNGEWAAELKQYSETLKSLDVSGLPVSYLALNNLCYNDRLMGGSGDGFLKLSTLDLSNTGIKGERSAKQIGIALHFQPLEHLSLPGNGWKDAEIVAMLTGLEEAQKNDSKKARSAAGLTLTNLDLSDNPITNASINSLDTLLGIFRELKIKADGLKLNETEIKSEYTINLRNRYYKIK